ncbi:MAG: type II secretion system protein GspM [Pseudomonadota bacterium]
MTNPWRSGLFFVSLCVVVGTLWFILLKPWMKDIQRYNENIQILRIEKQRLQGLVAQQPQFEDQLAKLDRLHRRSGYFFDTPSPEVSNQELIDRIETIIDSGNGKLVCVRSLSPTTEDNRLQVRVQLYGNESLLINLLHQLEGSLPVIIIDKLHIRSRPPGLLQKTGTAGNSLDIRFDVIGFLAWQMG